MSDLEYPKLSGETVKVIITTLNEFIIVEELEEAYKKEFGSEKILYIPSTMEDGDTKKLRTDQSLIHVIEHCKVVYDYQPAAYTYKIREIPREYVDWDLWSINATPNWAKEFMKEKINLNKETLIKIQKYQDKYVQIPKPDIEWTQEDLMTALLDTLNEILFRDPELISKILENIELLEPQRKSSKSSNFLKPNNIKDVMGNFVQFINDQLFENPTNTARIFDQSTILYSGNNNKEEKEKRMLDDGIENFENKRIKF